MDPISAVISPLPPLYDPWVQAILGGSPPDERHATCATCAMCQPAADRAATASLTVFDPATKCCTYVPTLPNFLVGMALDDEDPASEAGRATIEHRIAKGVGVTPLGLQVDPQYAMIYKHVSGELFGRDPGLQCPHYLAVDGGLCGIWRHRNAVCATWFCKHERGRVGKLFWEALRNLLLLAERHLSLWAALGLGESLSALGPSLVTYYATMLPGPTIVWSDRWADRPAAFYRATAELVRDLSWPQVRDIGGPELSLLAERLRAAFHALHSHDLPDLLRFVATGSFPRQAASRALLGYSTLDLPTLPTEVAEALPRFDGTHATAQVCGEPGEAAPIERDTVRRMVDYEVLVPIKRGD